MLRRPNSTWTWRENPICKSILTIIFIFPIIHFACHNTRAEKQFLFSYFATNRCWFKKKITGSCLSITKWNPSNFLGIVELPSSNFNGLLFIDDDQSFIAGIDGSKFISKKYIIWKFLRDLANKGKKQLKELYFAKKILTPVYDYKSTLNTQESIVKLSVSSILWTYL